MVPRGTGTRRISRRDASQAPPGGEREGEKHGRGHWIEHQGEADEDDEQGKQLDGRVAPLEVGHRARPRSSRRPLARKSALVSKPGWV